MINVLLVDDHELARTGIEALLNDAEDITVAGVAKSSEEAIDAIATRPVDVVLMGVNMPGIDGIEACRKILQDNPDVKIITLFVNNDGPIPPTITQTWCIRLCFKRITR